MMSSGELTEEDRSTPLGIIRFSLEYFAAAVATQEKLERAAPGGISAAPVYTLAGQSVELALKAFVRLKGANSARLKMLGHDLERGLAAAEAEGFSHAADRRQLALLNQEYSTHRFRYIRTGFVQLVQTDYLFQLVASIFEPSITAIPGAWRFMWHRCGEIVSDAGWLSPIAIKNASPVEDVPALKLRLPRSKRHR